MRRTVLSFLMVICLAGMAFASSPLGNWGYEPSAVDSGGPDLYGYTWKASSEPGGQPFAWKDISVVGTLVPGLGDDNYVGPFPIGFTFHYYWYDVTQFWIGSNGYIEFSQPFNAASPFPNNIPLTTAPNDFLACYEADLDMSVGGQCRRWNNADSSVISWTNVPAWNTGGSHTFQIIMSRLDSNITFEHGVQTGTVGNNDLLVGIENVSGTMGLKHSNDVYPASNNAIFWKHPSNPTVVVHDMASIGAANANSEGIFVLQGGTVNPVGWVKNAGNSPETGFQVNCTLQLVGGGVVYNQSQTISTTLAPNAEMQVNFTPAWTAAATGTYFYKITTTLTGDMNPNNNLKQAEMGVITIPGTMGYDDGVSEQGWSWQGGNGGLGQHFVPPSYPAHIDCVRFFIPTFTGTPHNFTAQVLDDNGPNGYPGTVLWTANVATATGGQWYGGMPNLDIASGGFYVAWQMQDSLTAPIGVDNTTTVPQSRQGWEFTGVWSGFRNSETGDIMIRTKLGGGSLALDVTLTPVSPPIIVQPGGGSFQFNAAVVNHGPAQTPFWVWARMKYPNGTYSGPTLGPVQINPPLNITITRLRTQNIAASHPAGVTTYLGYANTASQVYPAIDSSFFTFQKLAVGATSPWFTDNSCGGELFPGEILASTPASFAMVGANPNPFNPATTLSFSLPEIAKVTLNVFDVQGRLVATLVNGLREAGQHQVTFDGSNLSSGVYLYTLQAGSHSATGKMVLMK